METRGRKEMEAVSCRVAGVARTQQVRNNGGFQMPLHYPKFSQTDYETMPEWQLDRLLSEYGLPVIGNAEQKRKFAMGAFLWPHKKFTWSDEDAKAALKATVSMHARSS